MIISITVVQIKNLIWPEKKIPLDHKETLVMVIPCYNETVEECTKALDSLIDEINIDEHKKCIMVVCDGRVRGPGMGKSCGDYLNDDILTNQSFRGKIKNAVHRLGGKLHGYRGIQGHVPGVPFYCIVKEQNQGKRDSLIVVRSFLYKHNVRHTDQHHIFSDEFFGSMSSWLNDEVGIDQVDHLIGMDADTVFAPNCIDELLKEFTYPHTVGVCGYVAVDFTGGSWNPWFIYQDAEYCIAQGLRQLHQSYCYTQGLMPAAMLPAPQDL
jgi:chitin synthase